MKIKRIVLFLLFVGCALLLVSKEERKLKVVTAEYEPFVIDSKNKLEGLDIDILTEFAQKEGYSLSFEKVLFPEIWQRLDRNEADVACGALYLTKERDEKYLSSLSYFNTGLVIVSSASSPINNENELKLKRVGVKKGATGEQWAKKASLRNIPFLVAVFDDTEACFSALKNGEIDALLNDYVSSRIIINKNYLGDMVISSNPLGVAYLEENELVFYFSKDKEKQQLEFNKFLTELKESGNLDKLKKKWIAEPYLSRKELYIRFFILAVLLILFILLVALYQRKILRKKAYFLSEKRYKELIYEAPIAVVIHKEGKLLFANKELCRIFGYKEEDLPNGFPVIKLFAEGEHQKLLSFLEMRKKGENAPFNYEVYGLKSDGTVFPVEVDVSLLELSGERVTILFIKDISEKKSIFEELRKSEEKYRKVFESVSEGIFISSKEGKPLLSNPALIKMLGYDSLEEILNRDIEKEGYLDPNERKRFKEIMEREGKVENFETIWLKKDKTPIYVIESAHALRDEKGNIFAYEGTVRD
ncbi:MAG: transporter substrate-binding domain-containing protein, partial [Acidobacteria bacterium]|nr:transporter substrate-binding domain-containing protein [Acidobacteriota bacterium]